MEYTLHGKVAVITGANQGLGLGIARHFLKAGANLALCARNEQLLEEVGKSLTASALPNQKVLCLGADVSLESDVKNFISNTLKEFGSIDILVNNAGIYGPKGEIENIDWGDWVKSIEINLFGSVLMCRSVLPCFKKQGHGKIIQLSGGGATSPMPNISGYAVSKAAIVRFIETLAEEVRDSKIDVNAIAPGALNTRLLDEIIKAGPDKVGKVFYENSLIQKKNGGSSFDAGTSLALFLASEHSNGITGKLISALWDDWTSWPHYLKELNESDIYTLRRITGKERGMNWGDK